MEDIHPAFVPRVLKELRVNTMGERGTIAKDKGKGKMVVAVAEKPKSTNLLTFFSVYLFVLLSILAVFMFH